MQILVFKIELDLMSVERNLYETFVNILFVAKKLVAKDIWHSILQKSRERKKNTSYKIKLEMFA